MTDVKRVFITLGLNRVEEGFYRYSDGVVTMTYFNGETFLTEDDTPVTATAALDMVEPVARALTKRIRKWALGDSVPGFERGASIGGRDPGTSDGFGRSLTYSSDGWM
jgi:hypothetical protein